MANRSAQSLRNILVGLIVQFIEVFLKFFSRSIFIRSLPIVYLGVNGLFGEILTMLSLAELGLGGAIGYALYKPLASSDKEKIASLMAFYKRAYALIGSIVLVLGLSLVPFLGRLVRHPDGVKENITFIYLLYLFNVVFSYFFSYRFTLLSADQKTHVIQSVKAGISISRTLIQSFILLVYHNFYAYLIAETAMIFLNNLFLYVYVGRHYPFLNRKVPPLEKSERWKIFKNIRALSIYKISTLVVNSTENTIIGLFVGLKEVGYYSNYVIFIYLGTSLLASIFSNISASVGNLNAETSPEHSHRIFKAIHLMNFWLYSLFSIGFLVCIEDVLRLWLGEEFLLGTPLAIVLSVNFYIKGMQNAVWVFKDSFGLFRYGQYLAPVQAGLHLGLACLLGWRFGICGILGAASIARLLTTVWYDAWALFKHGFHIPVRGYYRSYLCSAILFSGTAVLVWWLSTLLHNDSFAALLGKMLLSITIPNLLYMLLFARNASFLLLSRRFRELLIEKWYSVV